MRTGRGSNPVREKKNPSPPEGQDRPCGPANHLFHGYWGSSRDRGVNLATHLHLAQRLRMNGDIFSTALYLYRFVARENFTLLLPLGLPI